MKRTPCIVFISSILAIYVVILCFYMSIRNTAVLPEIVDRQIVTVSEGNIISNGQQSKFTLPTYFDVNGETKLQFTLNYEFSDRTVPSLILEANHTFITVLFNGDEIYSVEPQPYSFGNYFTHILLPQKAIDAKLEIYVTVPKNGISRVSMPSLIIANEAVYLEKQILRDTPSLMMNTLILLSGVILLTLVLINKKSIDPYRMLLRGLVALNCAMYFMCETYSVIFLSNNARMVYICDMLSFAILAPTLLAMLGWELKDWRGKLLNFIAALGMVNAVVQVALSWITGIELRKLLPMTHVLQVASILAVTISIVYGLICKKSNKGIYIGAPVALGGAIDLILFFFEIGETNVFFMKIGLLIYLLYQMYQFILVLMQRSAEEARESYYKILAMQDSLSHCYSRAAFELDKMAWNGESVVTAFFLDLNNLKNTNDKYGHSAGDQLINAFGDVLNRVFFSVGKCYRVGGDEFWVFCDNLAPWQAEEIVLAAQHATDTYNQSSDLPTKLSYAIGMCSTDETNGNLIRAIELADERMYENKRIVKQQMILSVK
ncbi:MAG: GGDEF domain-containing protein [Oscillospiraceae bacterium]